MGLVPVVRCKNTLADISRDGVKRLSAVLPKMQT